jgi:hypothetical protein
MKLESAPFHPGVLAMYAPWRSARQHEDFMAKLPHLVPIGLLLRDTSEGEVRVGRDGEPVVELYYSDERARREASAAEAVELARGEGDARLLGQVLNNAYLAQWTADREVQRRAITEEALALVGRGLPAKPRSSPASTGCGHCCAEASSRPTTPSSRRAGAEARARGDLALLVSRHPALTSDLGPVADIVAPAVVIARAVGMQALLAELDDLVRKTREPGRGQPVTSNTATT